MFCSKCGKHVNGNEKLCWRCGASIADQQAILEEQGEALPMNEEPGYSDSPTWSPSQIYVLPEERVVRGMWENFKYCLREYATFKGRASMHEYWQFLFVSNLIYIFFDCVQLIFRWEESFFTTAVRLLYSFGLIIPIISVIVRRLHDKGHSGWFFWVVFIPIIGIFWLLYKLLMPGSVEDNRFGARNHYLVPGHSKSSETLREVRSKRVWLGIFIVLILPLLISLVISGGLFFDNSFMLPLILPFI